MKALSQLVIMLSTLLCAKVAAEQYVLSATQLTQELQSRFPIIRVYQGVEAIFSQPKLLINHLDNEIKIAVTITVTQQNQTLKAEGVIVDKATIQAVNNTLRFAQPKLDEFFVTQDNMVDSQEALRIVKQTIGQTLPPLILLELEKIAFPVVGNHPTAFTLSARGLILEY